MKELTSSIEIDAPPERVWQVLTDFPRYVEWNPMIPRISGDLKPRAQLEFDGVIAPGRTIRIRPVLLAVDQPRELRWRGRLLLPGLFDGEHSFRIEPLLEDSVRFEQRERFTGILVPLIIALIGKSSLRGFEEANRALKNRCERSPASL